MVPLYHAMCVLEPRRRHDEAVLSRKHANPLVICDLPTRPASLGMARLSPTPTRASQPSAPGIPGRWTCQ